MVANTSSLTQYRQPNFILQEIEHFVTYVYINSGTLLLEVGDDRRSILFGLWAEIKGQFSFRNP